MAMKKGLIQQYGITGKFKGWHTAGQALVDLKGYHPELPHSLNVLREHLPMLWPKHFEITKGKKRLNLFRPLTMQEASDVAAKIKAAIPYGGSTNLPKDERVFLNRNDLLQSVYDIAGQIGEIEPSELKRRQRDAGLAIAKKKAGKIPSTPDYYSAATDVRPKLVFEEDLKNAHYLHLKPNGLTGREAEIYLLSRIPRHDFTPVEIAKHFGVSPQHIRQTIREVDERINGPLRRQEREIREKMEREFRDREMRTRKAA
ncbi:MAG: hypothetical protein AABX01_07615 [Candidatus Micrarchaeota archaeon]